MFWGYARNYDPSAHLSAGAAESTARSAMTEVQELRSDVERLLMITEALWTILKEKFDLPDEELIKRVVQIDLRDGKLDGRVSPTEGPPKCPHCGRVMGKKRPTCMYCGKPVKPDLFER